MTRRSIALFLFACLCTTVGYAQNDSPYKTSWKVDGPVIAGGVGLSYLGLTLIQDKKGLTPAEVATLDKDNIFFADRFAAGNYSTKADKISYYPFYAAFAMPVAMLLDKNESKKAGQILVLYTETMAITATLYTMTAGNVDRYRPFVYGSDAPMSEKTGKGATRSFFAGHTAATASATFFAAKVYSDFNPDSRAKPYVWAAAAIIPAAVAYYRTEAGMHFLTDNIVGYAIGAGVGILVPELHKKDKNSSFSMVPIVTPEGKQVLLSYRF